MYETNMLTGTCTPCSPANQLQIPFRHMQAVLYELERSNPGRPPGYHVLQYFNPTYLVRTIHDGCGSVEINLPIGSISTRTSTVQPPPVYRQAGSRPRSLAADAKRGEKRIRSNGEELVSERLQRTNSATSSVENSCDSTRSEHDDTEAIDSFFASLVSAKSKYPAPIIIAEYATQQRTMRPCAVQPIKPLKMRAKQLLLENMYLVSALFSGARTDKAV
ncbi:hypothetical protein JG688_00014366 [Phytophthora aleatoria]|uniref:Uncharacterized protein n=1 Tax=Phytophthora aleatoria TaxID=2496075 RepID=A0A8J5IL74_9STRA|nr:hypothetical protein JG688_00014366 [Phytophthora aleatoria]